MGSSSVELFEERARERLASLGDAADTDAMMAIMSLVRVANRITADLEGNVYRQYGVSYAGFRVLFTCWQFGPLEPKRIASLASVSRASVSSALNTLERDGLISRSRTSADRRLVTVDLTDAGRDLMERSHVEHHAREREWAGCLTPNQQKTLTKLLRTMLDYHPPAPASHSDELDAA